MDSLVQTLQKAIRDKQQRWGKRIIIMEDVPADVCQQCGEVYFAPHVLQAMGQLVEAKQKEKPKKEIRVPVYSLSEL